MVLDRDEIPQVETSHKRCLMYESQTQGTAFALCGLECLICECNCAEIVAPLLGHARGHPQLLYDLGKVAGFLGQSAAAREHPRQFRRAPALGESQRLNKRTT